MRKITKKLTAIILAATLLLSPIALHAAAPPEPFELTKQVATEQATQLMEALSIAGMTIALVDAETGYTWLLPLGYADAENQTPVTEHTLFSIGSTAKLFTAVAIMQLVEDGLLDLDEPIVTYLPEFSLLPNPVNGGNSANITTRMLLTHVSGIHEFGGDEKFALGGQDRDFYNRLLANLSTLHMQNAELNRLTYSNTAYAVLGILLARLTGSTNYFDGFVRYTQENIFTPAGMHASSFEINASNRPNISRAHADATTVIEEFIYVSASSVGGMVSSAYDMAQFMHVMLTGGGDVLQQETIYEMRQPQDFGIPFPNDLPNMPMGLGLMHVAHADGVATTGHGGNLQHHTEFLLDFENGIGVFVSGNSAMSAAASTPLATLILRTAVEEKTGQPLQPTVDRSLVAVTNPQQLVGFYNSHVFTGTLEIVVCEDGNPNILGIPGLPVPLALTPAGAGSFESLVGSIRFQETEGIMFMFMDTGFGPTMIGERVQISQASPAIDRWLGDYLFVDDDGEVLLITTLGVNENGHAYMSQMGLVFLLNEVDEYTLHAPGRIRSFGSIVTLGMDGDVAYMRYSGAVSVRLDITPAETDDSTPLRFVLGSTEFTHGGNTHHMEYAPFMDTAYDRTMVPLRVISEIFGAEVDWIPETRTATIVLGDISLAISADESLPGGLGVPYNMNGHIFVPLRYVAYAFGAEVRWDGANQAAYVFIDG